MFLCYRDTNRVLSLYVYYIRPISIYVFAVCSSNRIPERLYVLTPDVDSYIAVSTVDFVVGGNTITFTSILGVLSFCHQYQYQAQSLTLDLLSRNGLLTALFVDTLIKGNHKYNVLQKGHRTRTMGKARL